MVKPTVFLSYSQEDGATVVTIHKQLEEWGITIWRDQNNIYGGEAWPKALGEAIQKNDFFLLCWSQSAKESFYVELEWTTALALRTPIIPYLLDDTALPETLRSIQGVRSIEAILKALQKPVPARSEWEEESINRTLASRTEAIQATQKYISESKSLRWFWYISHQKLANLGSQKQWGFLHDNVGTTIVQKGVPWGKLSDDSGIRSSWIDTIDSVEDEISQSFNIRPIAR